MPRPAVDYIPRPYVRPAYEPDTRTLMDLVRLAGASRADAVGRKGQVQAQGVMNLGNLISQALGSLQQEGEQKAARTMRQSELDRDEAFRRDQLASVEADRVERRELASQAAQEKQRADPYRRGGEIAEQVEYGPIDESQVDDVMAGPAAGRARYVFGPGTSDGPELQPSPSQRRGIETEQQIKGMGGMIGPNGQVIMPPKVEAPPTPESRLTGDALLEYLAQTGNEGARRAMAAKEARELRMRPPVQPKATPAPPKMPAAMAQIVAAGKTSLDVLERLEGMYTQNGKNPSHGDAFIGPMAGRYNSAERGAPAIAGMLMPDAPQGFEDFAAESATLKNQIIQAITGAAVGVQEQGRIMQQIPQVTDTPANWKAKAKSTRRNLQALMANQIRMGTGAQGPLEDGTTVTVGGGTADPLGIRK